METKSVIAIQSGLKIRAILCETGDYVDLAPRLRKLWILDQVKDLIEQGNQQSISDDSNIPSMPAVPAVTFYNFRDFMRYFENMFCEEFYIMDEGDGIWYYASPGSRTVTLLDIKLQPLFRKLANPDSDTGYCYVHNH
jgi:hypothetical protein